MEFNEANPKKCLAPKIDHSLIEKKDFARDGVIQVLNLIPEKKRFKIVRRFN
jgi:hypothetical protein